MLCFECGQVSLSVAEKRGVKISLSLFSLFSLKKKDTKSASPRRPGGRRRRALLRQRQRRARRRPGQLEPREAQRGLRRCHGGGGGDGERVRLCLLGGRRGPGAVAAAFSSASSENHKVRHRGRPAALEQGPRQRARDALDRRGARQGLPRRCRSSGRGRRRRRGHSRVRGRAPGRRERVSSVSSSSIHWRRRLRGGRGDGRRRDLEPCRRRHRGHRRRGRKQAAAAGPAHPLLFLLLRGSVGRRRV